MANPKFTTPISNPFGLTDVGSWASPTFADIDGDGDLDALVGNSAGDTLFYRNKGNASNPVFVAPVTNPFKLTDAGTYASPTLVDIDGDGDLDAFVGNGAGNTLFYRNNGTVKNPDFAAPSTNSFGLTNIGNNANPVFADIDGDGDQDAFVGNSDGNTLFYRNTGNVFNPFFAAPDTNPFGLTDVGFNANPSFADIDGDGDLDAIVGNGDGNTLFYRNIGTTNSPAFATPDTNHFGLTDVGTAASPTLVDINGDGDLDAFVGNIYGNMLLYRNDAIVPGVSIVQTAGKTVVTEVGATDTYTVVLNSKPIADVTINLDNTNQQVSSGTNSLTFTSINWNVPQKVTITAINDLVGEGKHTGVIQHQATSTDGNYNGVAIDNVVIAITDNDLPKVDPIFSTPGSNPFGLKNIDYNASPVFVDIDSDGDLDAFVGINAGDTLFYRNTGNASNPIFNGPGTNSFGLDTVDYGSSPVFADIDGDGDLDAFVGNSDGNTLFFRNTGTASSPAFAAPDTNPFGLANFGYNASPTFADLDGDGDLDAFVGNSDGNTLFYRNNGTASNPAFDDPITNHYGLTDVGSFSNPAFADLDGDGDLDASVGNSAGNTLFYRNNGNAKSPAFAAPATNLFGLTNVGFGASPAYADIDGDGDLDAFVGDSYGNTLFYRNGSISPIKIVQTGGSSAVTEGGATDTYTVVLKSQPTANVTINLDTTNQQVTTSSVNSLIFTPTNWNKRQTVTITAVDDTAGEGKHTGVIKQTITSADPHFKGIAIDNIIVAINDNDLPSVDPVFTSPNTNPFGLKDVGVSANPTFADIDGDGDLDAFVGKSDGNALFYRNTGTVLSPVFATTVNNPFKLTDVGNNANPAFADIDGDGDLDAFVGNGSGNTLFFRNTGSISSPVFTASKTNPFGLTDVGYNASPNLVDIDADGDLDAFVGNMNGNTLFYRNTGTALSPVFAAPATNPFGLKDAGSFSSATFSDIDGDGDLDAIVGNGSGNTLFFRNTGSISSPVFSVSKANPFGLTDVGTVASPTLVDIDGDGDLDSFVGNKDGNTLLYRNDAISPGVSIVQTAAKTVVTEGGATDTYSVVLNTKPNADVTIKLDITNKQVTGSANSLTFTSINWNEPQTVTVTAVNDTVGEGKHTGVIQHQATSTDSNYNSIAIDKVNIAITDNDLSLLDPIFNTPSANPFDLTDVGYNASPTFADIDSDGDLDAFVGNNEGNTLFFRNFGTASNAEFTNSRTNPFGLNNIGDGASPAFADIDGDGDMDAFVGNNYGDTQFFRNTGTASNPAFASPDTNAFGLTNIGSNASPTFADIDNDGDLDAFVGNSNGDTRFFRNTGTASNPEFVPKTNAFGLTDVGSYAKPTFADIDGDGDLDALVGNNDGDTLLFRNTGAAKSPAFAGPEINPFGLTKVGIGASPTFADVDGDGKLDAFIGESDGNTLFYLAGTAPTATNLNQTITYTEDTTAAIADIVITDPDADTFTATLILAGGNSAIGSLSASSGNGETYNAVTGVWAVAGTKATVNAALAGVSFVPVANGFTDTSALVSISDGVAPAITGTLTFKGTAVNDAPVLKSPTAVSYTDTIFDDTFASVTGLLVATDIDSNSLTYGITGGTDNGNGTISKTGDYGKLTVTRATGAYSFEANDDAIERLTETVKDSSSFKFTVSDDLLSKTKTLTLNIAQSGTTESIGKDTLTGTSGNDKFDGLAGNDIIKGLAGDDTLNGGAGNDVLTGGDGKDIFQLTTLSKDTITDFSVVDDRIQLENSVFAKLTATGDLHPAYFKTGTAAIDTNDYVIYNSSNGALFYDADGNGAGAATQIAMLGTGTHPALTYADFFVI